MDMVKMGRFLAELTQGTPFYTGRAGRKTGRYKQNHFSLRNRQLYTPVEMLEQLSTLYDLSINELLCGKKLTAEEYKDMAETTIKETLQESAFTIKEKQAFFKKKWVKEHAVAMVITCILGVLFSLALANMLWLIG